MNKVLPLILLHIWLAFFLYLFNGSIRGNLAERNYHERMKPYWRWWLMPGKLSNKDFYIRFQRIFAWVALPVVIVVYIGFLFMIFGGE